VFIDQLNGYIYHGYESSELGSAVDRSTDNGLTWTSAGSNRFTFNGNGIYYAGDRWVAVGDGGAASIRYSIS
jgi:hypothetical protein